MQAQSRAQNQEVDTAQITEVRSEVAVKTLITAGFGCLMDLLPDENFEDARLSSLTITPGNDEGSRAKKEKTSSVRVKTIKRGYSTEGDTLLDYVENGIFDALEKHYLKSFVFGIYLDKDDPTNIIESWTFNFRYPKDPETGRSHAHLAIDNQLANMSLSGSSKVDTRGVAGATTIGDVKRSLKSLTKAIISSTQGMEALPGRRYATFKIFYNDDAPADYEAPSFVAGDAVKDVLVFSTHSAEEAPEKVIIGSMDSFFHTVSVSIGSVAAVIPSGEDNAATYSGLNTSGPPSAAHPGTFASLAHGKQRESEIQTSDARNRKIVWDADSLSEHVPGSEDAEGEPDPAFANMRLPKNDKKAMPLGVRHSDGTISPWVPPQPKPAIIHSRRPEDRSFNFTSQTSTRIDTRLPSEGILTQPMNTQAETPPQTPRKNRTTNKENLDTPSKTQRTPREPTLAPLISNSLQLDTLQTQLSAISEGIDTLELKKFLSGQPVKDSMHDSISSFGHSQSLATTVKPAIPIPAEEDIVMHSQPSSEIANKIGTLPIDEDILMDSSALHTSHQNPNGLTNTMTADGVGVTQLEDMETQLETQAGLDTQMAERDETAVCVCQSKGDEINWIFCSGCNAWFHTCCMGFNGGEDTRIPPGNFACFTCRLKGDPGFALLSDQTVNEIQIQWGELTLFRRALKIVSSKAEDLVQTQAALKKRLEIDSRNAGQVWTKLEQEGFIAPEAGKASPLDAKKKTKGKCIRKRLSAGISRLEEKSKPRSFLNT
ncbi:hypothetical protein DL93DRAFT_2151415 [Clavulina sp. PMI_390]|nr:hypothetical protein DL93DRAFT_2151415 [Clavulina sp. PMI_390]